MRACNGTKSRWYQATLKQKAGKIKAAEMEEKVRFEMVSGNTNEKIDDAYRRKYSNSPYQNLMISERTKASTVWVFQLLGLSF